MRAPRAREQETLECWQAADIVKRVERDLYDLLVELVLAGESRVRILVRVCVEMARYREGGRNVSGITVAVVSSTISYLRANL